jgi:hypothetical protein
VLSQFIFIYEPASWVLLTVNFTFFMILVLCPQLLYVLPYKAHRLNVFEIDSGMALFQYEWSSEGIDEFLLSGLISAIKNMGEELLQRGRLKQIDWEQVLLFFSKSDHIIVTLLSSKASKSLRSNLNSFTIAFENKFKSQLTSEYHEIDQFKPATVLIDQYFGNLPKR